MEDAKQIKKYNELTLKEKNELNREYLKTFFRRSIIFIIVILISMALVFSSAGLLFANLMFNKKSIITALSPVFSSIGIIFAIMSLNLMWRKKDKSVLQQLGKKMIIVFIVSITVSAIGTILYLIYLFEIKNLVLYYLGWSIMGLGAIIPCIAVLKLKGKGVYVDDEFFQWLEKEKSIIKL